MPTDVNALVAGKLSERQLALREKAKQKAYPAQLRWFSARRRIAALRLAGEVEEAAELEEKSLEKLDEEQAAIWDEYVREALKERKQ